MRECYEVDLFAPDPFEVSALIISNWAWPPDDNSYGPSVPEYPRMRPSPLSTLYLKILLASTRLLNRTPYAVRRTTAARELRPRCRYPMFLKWSL